MFTSPTSRWIGGTAGVCAVLLGVTYFALVGPRRDEAASLSDQTATTLQQNDATQVKTAQLRALYATLPQKQAQLSTMLGQMPVTADVPHFLRSMDALATSSGVSLDSLTPGAAAYVGGGTPGAGGADVRPVAVPVTLAAHGPYFKAVSFLKGLQTGQRAFLVNGLQVSVAGSDVTLTVKGSVFALPGAAQALQALTTAAATTTAPAGSATPAPAAGAPTGTANGTTPAAGPSPSPAR